MLHLRVSDDVRWMYDVLFASLEVELVDLTPARQGKEPTAGDMCVAPVCQRYLRIRARRERKRMSRPRQQRISLCDHPIHPAIQMYHHQARIRRPCRNERRVGSRGGYPLIDERYAERRPPQRPEQRESRDSVFGLAIEPHQGAFAGVQILGGGDVCGEKGEGRAEDFKTSIYLPCEPTELSYRSNAG